MPGKTLDEIIAAVMTIGPTSTFKERLKNELQKFITREFIIENKQRGVYMWKIEIFVYRGTIELQNKLNEIETEGYSIFNIESLEQREQLSKVQIFARKDDPKPLKK